MSEILRSGSSDATDMLWNPMQEPSVHPNPHPGCVGGSCPSLPHRTGYINTKACNFKMQAVGWTTRKSVLGCFEV